MTLNNNKNTGNKELLYKLTPQMPLIGLKINDDRRHSDILCLQLVVELKEWDSSSILGSVSLAS